MNAWTQSADQDTTIDRRGWPKGTPRGHADTTDRILALRDGLVADATEYYVGPLAIQQRYAEAYPDDDAPGLTTIKEVLRSAGRSKPPKRKRRGTARYRCYPVVAIRTLGERVADLDHIGAKWITGCSEPLHFLSLAFRNPRRLRRILRTTTEQTDEAITTATAMFDDLGWPDVLRMDCGSAFEGGRFLPARRVPRFARFLLAHAVIPVYGHPRKPWQQGVVEGSNSVFGRNFWERHTFTSLADVDGKLASFNRSSNRYAGWTARWERTTRAVDFIPRIGFIRLVEEADPRKEVGRIPVARTWVEIPKEYIGLYVFALWNLRNGTLTVSIERDAIVQTITTIPFPVVDDPAPVSFRP